MILGLVKYKKLASRGATTSATNTSYSCASDTSVNYKTSFGREHGIFSLACRGCCAAAANTPAHRRRTRSRRTIQPDPHALEEDMTARVLRLFPGDETLLHKRVAWSVSGSVAGREFETVSTWREHTNRRKGVASGLRHVSSGGGRGDRGRRRGRCCGHDIEGFCRLLREGFLDAETSRESEEVARQFHNRL